MGMDNVMDAYTSFKESGVKLFVVVGLNRNRSGRAAPFATVPLAESTEKHESACIAVADEDKEEAFPPGFGPAADCVADREAWKATLYVIRLVTWALARPFSEGVAKDSRCSVELL